MPRKSDQSGRNENLIAGRGIAAGCSVCADSLGECSVGIRCVGAGYGFAVWVQGMDSAS